MENEKWVLHVILNFLLTVIESDLYTTDEKKLAGHLLKIIKSETTGGF